MTKKLYVFGLLFVALFALVALVGCAPSSSDAAVSKMEKAGYTPTWTGRSEVGENGEVGSLKCVKGNSIGSIIDGVLDVDGLVATLYDSTSHAKAAWEASKNAEGKTSYTLVGKWVVTSASEEALKAFK